jgi:hypothetical protein
MLSHDAVTTRISMRVPGLSTTRLRKENLHNLPARFPPLLHSGHKNKRGSGTENRNNAKTCAPDGAWHRQGRVHHIIINRVICTLISFTCSTLRPNRRRVLLLFLKYTVTAGNLQRRRKEVPQRRNRRTTDNFVYYILSLKIIVQQTKGRESSNKSTSQNRSLLLGRKKTHCWPILALLP